MPESWSCTNVTYGFDSFVKRRPSLLTMTEHGIERSLTSGIDAGRMLPVAIECSMVATMIAKPTSGSCARIARCPSITSV